MRIIFPILFWVTFVGCIFAQNTTCIVTGKVVDNKNNLINTGVVIYKPSGGDIIEFEGTNKNGEIFYEYKCPLKNAYLFVGSYGAADTKELVSSPVWSLRNSKTYSNLAGVKIPPITKKTFDVGTLIAPKYFAVNLKLVDEEGDSILPKELQYNFMLIVKTLDGKIASWGGLSIYDYENYVKNSSVLVSFPEGKWILEVGFYYDRGPFLYPTKVLEFKGNQRDETQEITLVMTKKRLANIYSYNSKKNEK